MLEATRAGALVLALACVGCSAERQASADPVPPALTLALAERERQSVEASIRLSIYHACGDDRELRCQQFAPETLRGIRPTIPLRALKCLESGAYPRRVRDCEFILGRDGAQAVPCRMTLRELPGPHSLYWSDSLPPTPPPRSAPVSSVPDVPLARSSLSCVGSLLALTEEPERVDPAPKTAARAIRDVHSLITGDDYPLDAISKGLRGPIVMRLQIGSHGRIDRCTVTRSSGSEALDERTCQLLRSRAHFLPARNAAGKAVASEVDHSQTWEVTG